MLFNFLFGQRDKVFRAKKDVIVYLTVSLVNNQPHKPLGLYALRRGKDSAATEINQINNFNYMFDEFGQYNDYGKVVAYLFNNKIESHAVNNTGDGFIFCDGGTWFLANSEKTLQLNEFDFNILLREKTRGEKTRYRHFVGGRYVDDGILNTQQENHNE